MWQLLVRNTTHFAAATRNLLIDMTLWAIAALPFEPVTRTEASCGWRLVYLASDHSCIELAGTVDITCEYNRGPSCLLYLMGAFLSPSPSTAVQNYDYG